VESGGNGGIDVHVECVEGGEDAGEVVGEDCPLTVAFMGLQPCDEEG
jgi:hypothetical protein